MDLSLHVGELVELEVDLLVVSVFEEHTGETKDFGILDRALGGLLATTAEEESFKGKEGQLLGLHTHDKVKCRRVLVVGLGRREAFELSESRRLGAAAIDAARRWGSRKVAVALPPTDSSAAERASQFLAEGLRLAAYRFDRYMAEDRRKPLNVESVVIALGADFRGPLPQLSLARAAVVGDAVCLARDLVNEPGSEMTPSRLAEVAQALTKDEQIECKILGPRECEKQKMRLFLAVARGSTEEPRFIHLCYRPRGKDRPTRRVVLVGKGVTFDSGGLSLKPTANMVDMKDDMAGAAAVLGVMKALPQLGLKTEVHAIVAAAENMISGSAYKLGDVITGLGGKSVEITNTDAEGRLTLADALAYAVKLKPDEIVDVATLTGACVVALGPHMAGVMGSDPSVVERFLAAARRAGEDVWHLPLTRRLRDQLESPIADLKNSGERWGGALVAGLFLKEFVDDVPWIHLDIAGPGFAAKASGHVPQGGTGFGVAALLEYLIGRDGPRPE